MSRATNAVADLGDCDVNATGETVGGAQKAQALDGVSKSRHKTREDEIILAQALCPGPRVFRSEVYGVELELQEGSLEQDVNVAATISPQLCFVVCQTEYEGRLLSEEFLAMPFVSGPEDARFPEDKPALLRFFLGFSEDFLSEDVTDQQSMDAAIEKIVQEWYSPLSSPDGTREWVSLGSFAVKYRHEGNDREVWVETPLTHFSITPIGVKIDIPRYKHTESAKDLYYYEEISRTPRRMRTRAANLKIRFGNATKNFATFTSRPIIQTTDTIKEAETAIKAGTAVLEGEVGRRERREVRGGHLSVFQDAITTVVPPGQFVDFEMPCDLKAHKQMRVRVGVLQNLSSSAPDATGELQLLDERPVSGNMILVLRQPRLDAPSEYPKLSWPEEKNKIYEV